VRRRGADDRRGEGERQRCFDGEEAENVRQANPGVEAEVRRLEPGAGGGAEGDASVVDGGVQSTGAVSGERGVRRECAQGEPGFGRGD